MKKFAVVAIVAMFVLTAFSSMALAHPRCASPNGNDKVIVLGNGGHAKGLRVAADHSAVIDKCPE